MKFVIASLCLTCVATAPAESQGLLQTVKFGQIGAGLDEKIEDGESQDENILAESKIGKQDRDQETMHEELHEELMQSKTKFELKDDYMAESNYMAEYKMNDTYFMSMFDSSKTNLTITRDSLGVVTKLAFSIKPFKLVGLSSGSKVSYCLPLTGVCIKGEAELSYEFIAAECTMSGRVAATTTLTLPIIGDIDIWSSPEFGVEQPDLNMEIGQCKGAGCLELTMHRVETGCSSASLKKWDTELTAMTNDGESKSSGTRRRTKKVKSRRRSMWETLTDWVPSEFTLASLTIDLR